eukprot:g6667.t1
MAGGGGGAPKDASLWKRVLLPILNEANLTTVALAGRQVATALRYASDEDVLVQYLAWVMNRLTKGGPIDEAFWTLMLAMGNKTLRRRLRDQGAVPLFAQLLTSASGDSQAAYGAGFCLWSLTLVGKGDEDVEELKSFGQVVAREGPAAGLTAVGCICQAIATPRREKVVRVAVAALRSLVDSAAGQFYQDMLDHRCLHTVKLLAGKHWSDDDVLADIEFVKDQLLRRFKVLTSFEQYQKELRMGNLRWGPTHTEKFWREHARRFDEGEFGIVQQLIRIIRMGITAESAQPGWSQEEESKQGAKALTDKETGKPLEVGGKPLTPLMLSVACYDVGEFVRFYPQGKQVSKSLGAKEAVMQLLVCEDLDGTVKDHALSACSKMLVDSWDFYEESTKTEA